MKYVKKFERFISEKFVMGSPETAPVETPTETPTRPRPTRPGIVPTEVPSEQDAPLASAEKVINRLEYVYNDASEEDRKEIDSYFKQK
jgi:hypothetical protein